LRNRRYAPDPSILQPQILTLSNSNDITSTPDQEASLDSQKSPDLHVYRFIIAKDASYDIYVEAENEEQVKLAFESDAMSNIDTLDGLESQEAIISVEVTDLKPEDADIRYSATWAKKRTTNS
jgi:hypothetical protein